MVTYMSHQLINIFIDDSGVFCENPTEEYFVYSGYVFVGADQRESANREYRTLSDKIRKEIGLTGELKASNLSNRTHKRALVNVLKKYEKFTCVVKLQDVYPHIRKDSRSINRYKDYALKIALKRKLADMINRGILDADATQTILNVYIDEQPTSTDGFYTLEQSIYEEFRHGIANFNYAVQHPSVFSGVLALTVKFCDSKGNYLVQAADILANRMNASYNNNVPELRSLERHTIVTFPR